MRNSTFFNEAAIIANAALTYKNPETDGIEYGIKKLKYMRKYNIPQEFSDELFNAYADYYRYIATAMVKSFVKYKNDSERFKALESDWV